MPDIDLDEAQAWTDAVEDALIESANRHGLDPDDLMDPNSDIGARFLEGLDDLTESDIDDPAFARAVEAVAVEFADANPDLRVTEAEDVETVEGRVLEANGTAPDGGRVFRVEILRYGTSKNGNRYTEAVMRNAAPLYEGAKAYDHHRTSEELRTSTINGLVGSYRNVEATRDALVGDLHLLPSQTHVAEALLESIAAQAAGRPPLVGISHDVAATFKAPTQSGGRRVREAAQITAVQSADVVADPSAGGRAVRALESQITPQGAEEEESEVPTTEAVLAALASATPEQLAAHGLSRGTVTESVTPPERVVESHRVTEAGQPKTSWIAQAMIKAKAEAAGISPAKLAEALPEVVTEAAVDSQIGALKSALALLEREDLAPSVNVQVVRESREKKVAALDAFFEGKFSKGYRSFKQAYLDITGARADFLGSSDLNARILRESWGSGYDSADRVTESADTTTWAQMLGDSITRRVVAEYSLPSLQTWRTIVSDIQPVDDFRTQRVGRMGGYGTLPAVNEGAPYQPLTTPADEEATYAVTKRGGTEDLTLETIANDDRRVISKIPQKLGRAAAQTLYRFVWDMIDGTGVTCTYDSTVLFHTNHGNYDASGAALSQTNVGVGRRKMRDQAAYGDTSEILGLQPRYLVVPNELEELAFQICSSAVAVPATAAGPSDTPNINSAQGLTPILVPYFSASTAWALVADPNMVPTIEIGFYQGREDPEIFTQSDNSVGSMFNADVLMFKVRHIYSGTALDHRGFYKGIA